MADTRDQWLDWTQCLRDPKSTFGEQRAVAQAWCAWALRRFGIDETIFLRGDVLTTPTDLPAGEAISPRCAALCVREHQRTAVFLRGMDAPLSLPFALRYAPEEVNFTLMDFHAGSLAHVQAIAEELGVAASIRGYRVGDATTIVFASEDRPHVIGCEVLKAALKKEPQVAVTRALAPQLRAGGFFLPEGIDLDLAFIGPGRRMRRLLGQSAPGASEPCERMGRLFSFDAYAAGAAKVSGAGRLAGGSVAVPPHDPTRQPAWLLTRLTVFREHVLGDFDCSLTLPQRVRLSEALAWEGGIAEFLYEISSDPELRLRGETELAATSASGARARAG